MAFVCNMSAILFVVFRFKYGFTFEQLGRLILINFVVQMMADIIGGLLVHKVRARSILIFGASCTFLGYLCYSVLPGIMSNSYNALIIAIIIISIGSGIFEMLLSPLIDAIPSDTKKQDMALLHSFYAWGTAFMIIFSTSLFFIIGVIVAPDVIGAKQIFYTGLDYWRILPVLPSIISFILIILFSKVLLPNWIEDVGRVKLRSVVKKPYMILVTLAILFGAGVEIISTQWLSAFAEKGLGYSKFIGDLGGMLLFALSMGIARHWFGTKGEHVNINNFLIIAVIVTIGIYLTASLCPIPYVALSACVLAGFTTAMMWPGALSMAAGRFPSVGATMFAMMACAGDTGAASIPWLLGVFADNGIILRSIFGYIPNISYDALCLRAGLLLSTIFPIILLVIYILLRKTQKSDEKAID